MLGNIGDFSPDHHAIFIAEVVEILVVLVMGQTDGVAAHLLHERHILLVHFTGNGIAQTLAVLMAGGAVEGVAAPVQEEALPGVNAEAADTEPGANLVHGLTVYGQGGHSGVQIGVFHPVPQVGVIQYQPAVFAGAGKDGVVLGVQNGDSDFTLTIRPGFYFNRCLAVFGRGSDLDTGRAIIRQGKVVLVHHQQGHIPVDAAVEGEVRLLGVDPVIDGVVHLHGQGVFLLQQGGDVRPEGGIAAVVGADHRIIQHHGGAGIDPLKLQPDLLAFGVKGGTKKGFLILAAAPPVVVAAVLPVYIVPCVGQVQHNRLTARLGELPVGHQLDASAQGGFLLFLKVPGKETAQINRRAYLGRCACHKTEWFFTRSMVIPALLYSF